MKKARALLAATVFIVIYGLPGLVFGAAIRGGGFAGSGLGGSVTIHVKLQQAPGGPATGTISLSFTGDQSNIFFLDLTVTGGDLATAAVSGTATLTSGTPPSIVVMDEPFGAQITPGGPGVGGLEFNSICIASPNGILSVNGIPFPTFVLACAGKSAGDAATVVILLEHGNIISSP